VTIGRLLIGCRCRWISTSTYRRAVRLTPNTGRFFLLSLGRKLPFADIAEHRRVRAGPLPDRKASNARKPSHGLAPDAGVRRWQDWLTPAWKRIGGGCHLNRPIQSLIEQAGFRIAQLETGYMPGPKPMAFLYQGSAGPN
jgi:hypothetical protein